MSVRNVRSRSEPTSDLESVCYDLLTKGDWGTARIGAVIARDESKQSMAIYAPEGPDAAEDVAELLIMLTESLVSALRLYPEATEIVLDILRREITQ